MTMHLDVYLDTTIIPRATIQDMTLQNMKEKCVN